MTVISLFSTTLQKVLLSIPVDPVPLRLLQEQQLPQHLQHGVQRPYSVGVRVSPVLFTLLGPVTHSAETPVTTVQGHRFVESVE